MKKAILALAFVSTLAFVSCKESTAEKVDDATEVGNDMKEGAENMEKKMDEAVK